MTFFIIPTFWNTFRYTHIKKYSFFIFFTQKYGILSLESELFDGEDGVGRPESDNVGEGSEDQGEQEDRGEEAMCT